MSGASDVAFEITPTVLLKAYACGIFPMAESEDDPQLHWIEPHQRGILPLDAFHLPKRLARTIRTADFEVLIDNDFDAVIEGCAEPAPGRKKTWINPEIRRLYGELFKAGQCHTVEVWRGGRLIGGLYGVRLGGAFFGESMFHRERDASKIALAFLVARLKAGGFTLLDTQFVTDHLTRFGAIEVSRREYHEMLDEALEIPADFYWLAMPSSSEDCLQLVSHTS
ncbi:MAG: leucyl/phenylalanyl-tRNA--protein transferase [Rhodobiaceae bacterium]|nr:leucyl/phenylalanyl-tRNA--protein transferase [Rhodobiaceae bacterium]MCC0014329.1 leucyl/phenylalanyl-tRNA--protein transferase [Rhodobiaceae bacterium]MCC0050794.1 leucyl/phenylalanyl-tRNA--protein transferase [Rhodobiaceae bacterium]MCC0060561.1 leucyl/phenylalanyl-tRNA--protein transferase [Rhodobiaceae bacterium]